MADLNEIGPIEENNKQVLKWNGKKNQFSLKKFADFNPKERFHSEIHQFVNYLVEEGFV